MIGRRIVAVAVVLVAARGGSNAAAEPPSPPSSRPVAAASAPSPPRARLVVDYRLDLPVTLALGSVYLGTELGKPGLAPSACRWCRSNGFDDAGRALRWSDPGTAGALSNVSFALGSLGALALLGADAWRAGDWRRASDDALIVAEAGAAAGVLVQVVKLGVGRQRPRVHHAAPGTHAPGADDNLSFYSGHTTLAFALATACGTVATVRGYRLAPWVWAAGLSFALATAYLRLAADQHYATDVLVGAAVGALVGWAVPYLVHRRARR